VPHFESRRINRNARFPLLPAVTHGEMRTWKNFPTIAFWNIFVFEVTAVRKVRIAKDKHRAIAIVLRVGHVAMLVDEQVFADEDVVPAGNGQT
jgi:hypothetical protein